MIETKTKKLDSMAIEIILKLATLETNRLPPEYHIFKQVYKKIMEISGLKRHREEICYMMLKIIDKYYLSDETDYYHYTDDRAKNKLFSYVVQIQKKVSINKIDRDNHDYLTFNKNCVQKMTKLCNVTIYTSD